MRLRTSAVLPAVAIFLYLGAARPALATQVRIFETKSQAGFLAGTLEGVSVDSLGRMELAPRAEKVTALSEPFLLAAAAASDGWVVGTGNAGKVLWVDRKGTATELLAAAEPEVFAVWVDPDGTVFAGTSPNGKVYRITRGKDGAWKSDVFFTPGETYIWALARGADGSLLVATGTQGNLFKVSPSGKGEVLYDSDDTHVRSLDVLPGGDVLAGTAGEGLILRIGRDGQARTLYDAAEPEVVALAVAADGSFYAGVV
ncbi:MAG: WD40 repeat domain-containing protein, partial [Acidobacteriota bacterium]